MNRFSICKAIKGTERLEKRLNNFRLNKFYGKRKQGMRIKCPECGSIVIISEIKNDKCSKILL